MENGVGGGYYLLVFSLSAVVGAAEIVARYRQAPFRALATFPSIGIMALNGLVSCLVFYVVTELNRSAQTPLFAQDDPLRLLKEILLAGVGGLALLRTSLFKVRVGDTDLPFGPSAFVEILQTAADRTLDRVLAEPRAKKVQDIMIGDAPSDGSAPAIPLSFQQTKETLPTFCFALMQNVSAEEQQAVGLQVEALANSNIPEQIKIMNLGLLLLDVVGEKVLRTAVQQLRVYIGTPSSDLDFLEQHLGELTADDLLDQVMPLVLKLENVTEVQPDAFALEVGNILTGPSDAETKRRLIALELLRLVGQDTFKRGVESVSNWKAVGPHGGAPGGGAAAPPVAPAPGAVSAPAPAPAPAPRPASAPGPTRAGGADGSESQPE